MAPAIEAEAVERLLADQLGHGIGKLDFAAGAGFLGIQHAHHVRLQNIAAGQHQIGRRGTLRRLFDQASDLNQRPVARARIDDPVAVCLFRRDFQHGDDIAAYPAVRLDHLRQAIGLADHHFVREQDGERLVADDVAGAPDGVAEAERLLLANGDDLAKAGPRRLERREALAGLAHRRFKLEGHIEIIDQGILAATGDEDHLLDPRLARFVDRILDQRPVDDRDQLLGDALGGRQQARAETGDREDRLADAAAHCGVTGPA